MRGLFAALAREQRGLFAALAREQLDRDVLLDKTRLVLAEKELEVTKARANARVATATARAAKAEARAGKADARADKAELETTRLRLQAKNLEALSLVDSVNLRGAIGKFVEGIVKIAHVSIELSLSSSPSTTIYHLQRLSRKTRFCLFLASSPRPR